MPNPKSAPILLCKLADLQPTGAFNAILTHRDKDLDLIITMDSDGTVHGYHNVCPHIQTPLETFPHEFLDRNDPSLIVCSTHGARFRLSDGKCLSGPCLGQSLSPVTVTKRQGEIFLLPD